MYKEKESCAPIPSNYNNKTANEKLQDYMKILFTGSKEATTPNRFCMYPQKQQEQSNGHDGGISSIRLIDTQFLFCVKSKRHSISSFLTA